MHLNARVSRRSFLRKAAVGAAAPYLISSAALGRAGFRAPNDRITMGFIGVGNMGSGHVGTFVGNSDVQIVAICDVDGKKRDDQAKRVIDHYAGSRDQAEFKGVDKYNEFERLLERSDIDAVLIAVPDHWHAIIAIAACAAGKDVYCEKPLTLTLREAEAVVAAARQHGTVFQTGSQQRSTSNFRYACELVRNGRIGKLQKVNVGIGAPSKDRYYPAEPVRDSFDWDRWLGPAPWAEYNSERCSGNYSGGWRLVRDYSGGMTTDWGAHHYDIAQWGMGRDGSGPIEIIPPEVPDGEGLTFVYDDGVTVTRGGANGILFTGSDGKVEVNRGYFKTWPDEIGKVPIRPNEIRLYRSDNHQQDWLDCIRTRNRPICDVEIGASTITVCHLANIAYWTRRKIRWDPVRREIVGDEEAARWLDRPKRAPWRTHMWGGLA